MATRGKNNKNNKNYNDIIEEEQKKNNFVDVVTAPLTDDNFSDMEINDTFKIFFSDDF